MIGLIGAEHDRCGCGGRKQKRSPRCRSCFDAARAWQHGSLTGYQRGGCRCELCSAAGAASAKKWRRKNPDRVREVNLAQRKRPETIRSMKRALLKREYGMTLEQWEAMFAAQEGRCAICRVLFDSLSYKGVASVDHDHATGAIRDLLCRNCNNGLGQFLDSPDLLHAAAEYLERHRESAAKEAA